MRFWINPGSSSLHAVEVLAPAFVAGADDAAAVGAHRQVHIPSGSIEHQRHPDQAELTNATTLEGSGLASNRFNKHPVILIVFL